MDSTFQSPLSPGNGPDSPAVQQQVMSAQPTRVLEGEVSGPNYSLPETAAAQNGGEQRRSQEQLPNGVQRELPVQGEEPLRTPHASSDPVPPSGGLQGTASEDQGVSGTGIGVQGGLRAHAQTPTYAIHTPPPATPEQLPAQPQQSRDQVEQERTSPPPLPQAFRRAVQGEYWDLGGSERVMQEGRDGEAQSWFGDYRVLPRFGERGYLQYPGDPPPLPTHLREPERQGVWSGLARAGQALRRRMTGSTPVSPDPQPAPDRMPTPTSLL